MTALNIIRVETSDRGTFSFIIFGSIAKNGPDAILGYGLELPQKYNEEKTSCIPAGLYQAEKYNSPSKGDVIAIKNVPERTGIQIHIGNTLDDTTGCILIGSKVGFLNGEPAVLNSRHAMRKLLRAVPDEFMVNIIDMI